MAVSEHDDALRAVAEYGNALELSAAAARKILRRLGPPS